MMALLAGAVIFGLGRLALGLTTNGAPILVNVFWAVYELVMLSVVLDALVYAPETSRTVSTERVGDASIAVSRGRAAGGLG